jgi:quercetin dioxygenase-like cupin family protein
MAGITMKSFDESDETRTPRKAVVEVVRLGGTSVARFTVEPGWTWSEHMGPTVGTDSCQARHLGVVLSGSIRIVHDDGTESDAHAGDVYSIEPGHDACVLGDEPLVALEFESAETYAKA